MSESTCPLCRSEKHMRKARDLYGHRVCRKCYYALANRRQLAYVVDYVVFHLVSMVVFAGIGVVVATAGNPAALDGTAFAMFSILMSWLLLPLLFFCKDGFRGRSPGKALMGVQVRDVATYQPIGFGQSLKRNLPLLIPFVPLIVAFQLCKGRRWGDRWADTRVVWRKYAEHPVFSGDPLICANCMYDLTGNVSGACTECGEPLTASQKDALGQLEPWDAVQATAT